MPNRARCPIPLPSPTCSVRLGKDPAKLAVEVNRAVVARIDHPVRRLHDGDTVEIVTLVGGGSGQETGDRRQETASKGSGDSCLQSPDSRLRVAGFTFTSRLFTGTGKYSSYDLMQKCMEASGCEVTTVAVRRERLIDKDGKSLLDFLDLKKLTILPNTAGCFSAEDAIRHARLARELLANLGNPGRELGEARMPRRQADAAARSGGHARRRPSNS